MHFLILMKSKIKILFGVSWKGIIQIVLTILTFNKSKKRPFALFGEFSQTLNASSGNPVHKIMPPWLGFPILFFDFAMFCLIFWRYHMFKLFSWTFLDFWGLFEAFLKPFNTPGHQPRCVSSIQVRVVLYKAFPDPFKGPFSDQILFVCYSSISIVFKPFVFVRIESVRSYRKCSFVSKVFV